MKSRVIVAVLIEKEGKILLGQKPKDVGPYPNTWHLPGGGANLEVESLEDAVKREVMEETGLELLSIERLEFDEDYEPDKKNEMTHYVFLRFQVEPVNMNAKANDDLAVLKWFDKSELKNIPLARPLEKNLKERGWI